jgi:glycosyltransferase involved in cell wall biosynthesis
MPALTNPPDGLKKSWGFGSVVLAAFQPDEVLFSRQLTSIREQTVENYECIITADGEYQYIRDLVSKIVGDDPRFRVIGFDDRRGFYHNFERGLEAVSPKAEWVALSDQDDLWHADKLELLLPYLEHTSLVSGQARVVSFPAGTILRESTSRVDVPLSAFISNNQFTGSLLVFRRDLLTTALPFPRAPYAVHDHWLAVCAATDLGASVSSHVVQDYVQHAGNAIGEVGDDTSISIKRGWARLRHFSARYEGSTSWIARLRTLYDLFAGWSETLIVAAIARYPQADLKTEEALYGRRRHLFATVRFLRSAESSGMVPPHSALVFAASHLAGVLSGALYRNRSSATG